MHGRLYLRCCSLFHDLQQQDLVLVADLVFGIAQAVYQAGQGWRESRQLGEKGGVYATLRCERCVGFLQLALMQRVLKEPAWNDSDNVVLSDINESKKESSRIRMMMGHM